MSLFLGVHFCNISVVYTTFKKKGNKGPKARFFITRLLSKNLEEKRKEKWMRENVHLRVKSLTVSSPEKNTH
jgi:hypothetical protein